MGYRREYVMAHKPGYRMRGSGNWIAPRAGSYYRTHDEDMYYRGAGFRDWIKQAAMSAFSALIKYIVPHVKASGPDIAQMMTKYAASKAADYIKRTDKMGAAEGLVTQALSDLPGVVKDIVQKQVSERFEPLSEKVLASLKARGGNSIANREVMAEQAILDALPYIEEEIEPLRRKLALIERYGINLGEGRARDAHASLEKLSSVMMNENHKGALAPLGQLIETMILAVFQYLSKTNGVPSQLLKMSDSCCRISAQSNTMPFVPLLTNRLREFQDIGLDLGKGTPHMAALFPGLGTYEISPEESRGGFGLGASLALAIIPALVSGGIDLIGRATIPHDSDRAGSLSMTNMGQLEQDMTTLFTDIINKAIASNRSGSSSKRQLLCIAGPKPPTKRSRVK